MGSEFDLRVANSAAADGWEHLARQAPANLRRGFDVIRAMPRSNAVFRPNPHERCQYEITGGGRIWYLIDDERRTAWITYAGTGHPSETH